MAETLGCRCGCGSISFQFGPDGSTICSVCGLIHWNMINGTAAVPFTVNEWEDLYCIVDERIGMILQAVHKAGTTAEQADLKRRLVYTRSLFAKLTKFVPVSTRRNRTPKHRLAAVEPVTENVVEGEESDEPRKSRYPKRRQPDLADS